MTPPESESSKRMRRGVRGSTEAERARESPPPVGAKPNLCPSECTLHGGWCMLDGGHEGLHANMRRQWPEPVVAVAPKAAQVKCFGHNSRGEMCNRPKPASDALGADDLWYCWQHEGQRAALEAARAHRSRPPAVAPQSVEQAREEAKTKFPVLPSYDQETETEQRLMAQAYADGIMRGQAIAATAVEGLVAVLHDRQRQIHTAEYHLAPYDTDTCDEVDCVEVRVLASPPPSSAPTSEEGKE